MGENYALELRDISKRFGSVQANDHVNLTLRKSEILAILGENGSGKTTLMNMIYGIYYPDEGHIFVKLINDSCICKTVDIPTWQGMAQGIFLPFGITVDDECNTVRNGGFGSTDKPEYYI